MSPILRQAPPTHPNLHAVCTRACVLTTRVACAGYQWLAQGIFIPVFVANVLISTLAKAAAFLRCTQDPGERPCAAPASAEPDMLCPACTPACCSENELAVWTVLDCSAAPCDPLCCTIRDSLPMQSCAAGPETPTRTPKVGQIVEQVRGLWGLVKPRWLELWEVRCRMWETLSSQGPAGHSKPRHTQA